MLLCEVFLQAVKHMRITLRVLLRRQHDVAINIAALHVRVFEKWQHAIPKFYHLPGLKTFPYVPSVKMYLT